MKFVNLLTLFLVFSSSVAFASDFEITNIDPVFSDKTTGFGTFATIVNIKNNTESNSKLVVSCFYVGYTNPSVYYKNEPSIIKQYKIINLNPNQEGKLIFDAGFRSYHPETLGEIIVSIAGKGVVRSIPLKTRFHPESQD